jgi:hypothetical protein
MNHKILYPLIKSMPGNTPQHSSYMLANQKNEQHSQLINLKGGGNFLAPQIRTLYNPIEGKGQTPMDTAVKLANLQLQSSANRQYDRGVFKGGQQTSARKYKSNKCVKTKVKKTKQKKRKQLKNKNKTKNKKIY